MSSTMLPRASLILVAALAGACAVDDADPEVSTGVTAFTLTAATSVDVFEVDLTGTAEFGWTSPDPATLEILVEGKVVHRQNIDVSATRSAALAVTVPLAREGANEIVGVIRYSDDEATQRVTVAAAMAAPTVGAPVWAAPVYRPHESLVVPGTIAVTANAAYTVDAVEVSIDGGPWMPATSAGGGSYTIHAVNPDIGDSDVAVRVTTSTDFHTQTTVAHSTLSVAPIFDCATPAASMLPDNDLISNVGTENRTMVGYFGDPMGGHTVSFVIQATVPGDGVYKVASSTASYGTMGIGAAFSVGRLQCAADPCTLPTYSLTAYVDGVQLCSNADFGTIIRY